ncbi:amidase [Novipirellula artificiosorum]|uniref:Acylamidase n=1 Tax=Novipirellula artificiosorum TaxID=2528016 RepID=A0A5C6DDD1_9BACT|nr:amidase [Novipirellula artificiosorum]TWU33226.1 Acylamidase [Novipirellula artificiosorum]
MCIRESSRREFVAQCCRIASTGFVTSTLVGTSRAMTSERIDERTILAASATSVADFLRRRRISVTDLVDIAIGQIKKVNPSLNAVIHFPEELARQQAKQIDTLLDNDAVNWELTPLMGVPITIKDCLNVADMPTTSGVPIWKDTKAKSDATVVKRLRDAGAILIGKTNLPALMSAYETGTSEFGVTNNPYDLSHTPGGSSGGEAAIIASGGSWLGIGTDGLGSIRVPAHYCGVPGLRPGWGRVSRAGQVPAVPHAEGWLPDPGYTVTGPFARSVADLHLALSIMQGPDPRDTKTFPVPLGDYRKVELHGMKVAYWTQGSGAVLTPETERTLEDARRTLEERGVRVVDAKPPLADEIYDISQALYSPFFLDSWKQTLKEHGIDQLGPIDCDMMRGLSAWATPYSKSQVEQFQLRLPELRTGLLSFLREYDAILSPVTATPAPKHATTFTDIRRLIFVQLPAYLPAIPSGSVPCGFSDRTDKSQPLPIGVQVIARQFREDVVLAFMKALEDDLGGWQPPPILT